MSQKTVEKQIKKTRPLNILVVDDEEKINKIFLTFLNSEGYKVDTVITGKKALQLVRKTDFDVIFLDIIMPGIPGIEVLERVKEISPKTKVVMMTGSLLSKDLEIELRKKGVSRFLQKPFQIEDALQVLKGKN